MRHDGDPRLQTPDQRNRPFDVSERPRREGQLAEGCDDRVMREAKGQFVVASGLEDSQRAFQMLPRFTVLSGKPMRYSGCAVSDSGLGRIGPRLDVTQERLGVRPHRQQLAPHQATHPKAIICRQPFGRILVAACRLARLCERFRRLRRRIAARGDQRVAVGHMQLLAAADVAPHPP